MRKFYLPKHLILQFGITDICDLQCIMCPLKNNGKPFHKQFKRGFSETSKVYKIIDEFDELNIKNKTLLLQWFGESTLHKDYLKIVLYAMEKNIKTISLLTNNYSSNLGDWIKIIEFSKSEKCKIKEIIFHFSLDAVSENTYLKIKNKNGIDKINKKIEKIIEMVSEKKCEKLSIIVQFIEMKENSYEKEKFILKWSKIFNDNNLKYDIIYNENEMNTSTNSIYIKPLNELRSLKISKINNRKYAKITVNIYAPDHNELFIIGNWNKNGIFDNEYLVGFNKMKCLKDGYFKYEFELSIDSRSYFIDIFENDSTLDPNKALIIKEFNVKNENNIIINDKIIIFKKDNNIEYNIKNAVHLADNEPCGFLFSNITVHHNLNSTVCCSDINFELINLNIDKIGLEGFLKNEELHRLRMKHIKDERKTIKLCNECLFSSKISYEKLIAYLYLTNEIYELKKYLLRLKNKFNIETMLFYWALSYKEIGKEEKYIKKLEQGRRINSGGLCEEELLMAK